MATTYKLIASASATSNVSSLDFSDIPATYTDLELLLSVRYSGADTDAVLINLNGGSSTYNALVLRGTGSAVQSFTFSAGGAGGSTTGSSGSSQTVNTFTNTSIYFANYTGSNYKVLATDFAQEANVANNFTGFYANRWTLTSAISSISIAPGSGTWVQYSSAYLYGIKNS